MPEYLHRAAEHASATVKTILSVREGALREIDGVVQLLHDTRGASGDLQNVLSELLQKTGGGGEDLDPLAMVGGALGALVESLGRLSGNLGAGEVNGACLALRAETRDIVRSGLEFQMVAKLTAITVASLPSRSPELESYADSFGRITESLSAVSKEVDAKLGRMLAARSGALLEFAGAEGELERSRKTLEAEVERARASRARAIEIEIGAAASALREATRAELGKLVAAIQFADAFAQRSEHVAAALAMAEAADGPRSRALRRVAVALADDMANGMREACATLKRSILRLGEEGAAANLVFEAKLGDGDLAAAIDERGASLVRAAARLAEVEPRIDGIERRTGEIEALAGGARGALAELIGISRQIMVSAVNAGLIASRISSSGGPLSVLAAAAQSQALACSRHIDDCAAGLNGLIATMDGLELDRVRAELDRVTATARRLGDETRDAVGTGPALGAVAGRIVRVVEALECLGDKVGARVAAVEAAMARFDAALAPIAREEEGRAAPVLDPAALADLRAIYTMQGERDVHDRTLGIERALEATAGDDLDDVLF